MYKKPYMRYILYFILDILHSVYIYIYKILSSTKCLLCTPTYNTFQHILTLYISTLFICFICCWLAGLINYAHFLYGLFVLKIRARYILKEKQN